MTKLAIGTTTGILFPAEDLYSGKKSLEDLTFSEALRNEKLYCLPCSLERLGQAIISNPALLEMLPQDIQTLLRVSPVNGSRRTLASGKRADWPPYFKHQQRDISCATNRSSNEDHALLVGLFSRTLTALYNTSEDIGTQYVVHTETRLKTTSDASVERRVPDLLVKRVNTESRFPLDLVEAAEVQLSYLSPTAILERTRDLAGLAPRVTWYLNRHVFAQRLTIIFDTLAELTTETELRLCLFWKEGEELRYKTVSPERSSGPAISSERDGYHPDVSDCRIRTRPDLPQKDRRWSFKDIRLADPLYAEGSDFRTPFSEEGVNFLQLEIDLISQGLVISSEQGSKVSATNNTLTTSKLNYNYHQPEIPNLWNGFQPEFRQLTIEF